ncbi:MAG: alpha/beta hydrolase [Pseudomonadota bacterium]
MKALLLTVLVIYLTYAVVLVVLHPRFIYPFLSDDRVLAGFERVELTASDGEKLFVQVRAAPGPVVLYFMGNAGSLSLFQPAFDPHIAAGRHIVALEYRGGAGRPGHPSERVLKADALVAADFARTLGKPVVVQGFSLGTGLALHVGARRDVDRVILTAPYDRLCHLMATRAWLPACVLPFVQKWNALRDAQQVAAPALVLHGDRDQLIPPQRSMAYEALPNVKRLLISGAGHNDIAEFDAYSRAMAEFLQPLVSN